MAKTPRRDRVIPSSGNVFADLRLPNAGERQTKVRLALAINEIIRSQRLSQVAAARRLNVSQPKISALRNYRLQGFSSERLMNFLTALDRDVEIVIRQSPGRRKGGRILVTATERKVQSLPRFFGGGLWEGDWGEIGEHERKGGRRRRRPRRSLR